MQTMQDPEIEWLETVYKKGARQLTVRAVISGMLLGGVMCLSNLYVFFKTGWSMGVTVTASILAFAAFQLFRAMRLSRSEFTILENNAMCSVASAAGYMTGGGNMAAFGALLMITTLRPDSISFVFWLSTIAALGVFVAIPIKRQLINREKLAFPTGTATAETLLSMHGSIAVGKEKGKGEGTRKAKVLGLAAAVAGLLSWFRDAKASWMPWNIPDAIPLPFTLAGYPLKTWTIAMKNELVLVGAGVLMSFRTAWSILLGGVITYAVIAPLLAANHAIETVSYKAIVQWTVWPSAAILVSAGITSFLIDWRSIVRTFSGMFRFFGKGRAKENDALAQVECPSWWFPAGLLLLGPVIIFLAARLFQIPVWAGLIALPMAVLMGFVAARVTGETDITPTKAFGPVTQAVFGILTPGNVPGNIMSANITAGIGLHAADLLTDLKSGYMLGANPRQQFIAQMFGVVAGGLVVVPAFWLIIPDPALLGSTEWPAPSCLVWAGVSEAFSKGIDNLSLGSRMAIGAGVFLGILLAFAEKYVPKRMRAWVPSPLGIGISMVIPCSNSIAMFTGGLIAEILHRKKPQVAEYVNIPAASGFIAGESLVGVLIAALIVAGVLSR